MDLQSLENWKYHGGEVHTSDQQPSPSSNGDEPKSFIPDDDEEDRPEEYAARAKNADEDNDDDKDPR